MRSFLILTTIIIGLSGRAYCESNESEDIISVDFEVVKQGWNHNADIEKYYPIVEIHSTDEWSELWKDINSNQTPLSAAPNVDFENWFIVAVFDLEKPNLCYHFDIKHLFQDVMLPNSISHVSLDYALPGRAAICPDALAKNYEIVKIKRR